MSARNMRICVWCRNRSVDVCLEKCRDEGHYRYLDPDTLERWEGGPTLPPFRELMDLSAAERLALIYLSVYYREQEQRRDG